MMPIRDRHLLKDGDVLARTYKGKLYKCTVAQIGNGLGFRLEDGREFRTPSTAGKAITGDECNGNLWWHRFEDFPIRRGPKSRIQPIAAIRPVQGAVDPKRLVAKRKSPRLVKQERKVLPLKREKPATPQLQNIKRSANQAGVRKGMLRYWCVSCMENFVAKRDPETCPNGHPVWLDAAAVEQDARQLLS